MKRFLVLKVLYKEVIPVRPEIASDTKVALVYIVYLVVDLPEIIMRLSAVPN